LSFAQVQRYSPILHLPDVAPPLIVAYGKDETDEFERQSEDFFGAWESNGLQAERLVLVGKNHYEVIDGFLDAGSPLCYAVLEQMGVK